MFRLQEAAMRVLNVLSAMVLLLVGCESAKTPEQTVELQEPRERCDTVLTGSRIPQCNRGDVRTITRDEIERDGYTHRGTDEPGLPPRGR
jgi:hypothetical protein